MSGITREKIYTMLRGVNAVEGVYNLTIEKEDMIEILKEMGCECEELIKDILIEEGYEQDEENKEENI
jgi:ERCC4-type nuclease